MLASIVAEACLRWIWGFCDSPLCIASDRFEYICAPDQDRHRFGNHIRYNSYSQRSDEPDTARVIVLGLGDSVINGGVLTDQDSLATTLASDGKVQVLNISAGSWGPDNCAAYLGQYGTFGARKILLVASSHDAHGIMDFKPVVGVQKSFPVRQYRLAIWELVDRYLLPRLWKGGLPDPDQQVLQGVGIRKSGGMFNPGFGQLKAMSDSLGIPMSVYLHPDRQEFEEQAYNEQGEEIIHWAESQGVPLRKGLEMPGLTRDCYRDGIHLNAKGQKVLAAWMKEETGNIK